MLTYCTITKNKKRIQEIIKKMGLTRHQLSILYYGNENIDDVLMPNNENIDIYTFNFNNDYASLWNNVFSRATTEYVFWIRENDEINTVITEYLESDVCITKLNNSDEDCFSFNITVNETTLTEDRLIRRTLYPVWRERFNPHVHYEKFSDKQELLEASLPLIKSHISNDDEDEYNMYMLMYNNKENFSFENIIRFMNILLKEHVYYILEDLINKLNLLTYEDIVNQQFIDTKLPLYYKAVEYHMHVGHSKLAKYILQKIDYSSASHTHSPYFAFFMGRIQEIDNKIIAQKYYEMCEYLLENYTPSYAEEVLLYPKNKMKKEIELLKKDMESN